MKGIDLATCDPKLKARIEEALKKESGHNRPNPATGRTNRFTHADIDALKPKAKGKMKRHVTGEMNDTEKRYYTDHLEGKYPTIWFEKIRLTLADRTTYTPDFVTVSHDGTITVHETKGGFQMSTGRVKWKMAREAYPEFDFLYCIWKNKEWKIEK